MRWLLVVFLAGCGFKSTDGPPLDAGDDQGVSGDGSSSVDLAGVDLVGFDGSIDTCPHPLLLSGLETLSGSGPGGVLRFTITSSGLTPCSTLTAQGNLPQQPLAVAFVPPDAVAAATRDGLWLVGVDDVVRWSRPAAMTIYPVDVAPIVSMTGDVQVAVGTWRGFTSNPEIDDLEIDADGSSMPTTHQFTGTVLSMSASPLDPKHLLLLDNAASAADYDPWFNSRTTYVVSQAVQLTTIAGASQFGLNRVVWVDKDNNAVRYVRENNGNPVFLGPIACNQTCTLVHAVPDPTEPGTFLGLCEHAASVVRDIVRWKSTGGGCDILYAGTTPGANTRLSRLAVAN